MQNIDYIFKVVLIGSQSVGKSSIMTRYIDQVYNDSYLSTIGVDFKIKTITVQEKRVKMQIWDTAGQERFTALTQSHYRGAHGCICVFDVTSEKSLSDAQKFLKMTIEEYNILADACYLVANKIDLINRQVSSDQGKQVASDLGVKYIETSAKEDQNVQELFMEMANSIMSLIDQKKTTPVVPDNQNQRLTQTIEIKQKAGCC